ncbi:hypothetical protein N0V90_012620 [Kalmusia sp. IMI 367209]|nr:hypothetical protein N0V90_012620 [Kalmusia sp. IMI 367209]
MADHDSPPTLQLAQILSDLVSLRVCDPAAALALVSARPNASSSVSNPAEVKEETDVDIKRAKELVELHYTVKEAHRRGELGAGLEEARASVARAVGG